MHPIQASHLHDLATGAYSAVTAAIQADDIEQRAGLMVAAEHLLCGLKHLAWQYVEAAEIDEDRPRIDPAIARVLDTGCNLVPLAKAINQATGDELNADALSLVECNGDSHGWLVMDKATGRYCWHVTTDGRLTRQSTDHLAGRSETS